MKFVFHIGGRHSGSSALRKTGPHPTRHEEPQIWFAMCFLCWMHFLMQPSPFTRGWDRQVGMPWWLGLFRAWNACNPSKVITFLTVTQVILGSFGCSLASWQDKCRLSLDLKHFPLSPSELSLTKYLLEQSLYWTHKDEHLVRLLTSTLPKSLYYCFVFVSWDFECSWMSQKWDLKIFRS